MRWFLRASFSLDEYSGSRFSLQQLREAATRGSVDFKGWPFLAIQLGRSDWTYVIEDGLETFISTKDFGGDELVDFWRLQQSGFFYHRTSMRPSSMQVGAAERRCIVDFRAIAIYIAEAVHCMTRLYEGLLSDDVRVMTAFTLIGTKDRLLVSSGPRHMPLWGEYVCRIPEVHAERRHPIAEWRAGVVDHAIELAREVYMRFNWENPNLGAARAAVENLFARRL